QLPSSTLFPYTTLFRSIGLVYFTAAEKSPLERHLYRVSLDGTGFARLTKDAGTHAVVFAPNAAAFYDTYSSAATPQRQDLYRAEDRKSTRLNSSHDQIS